MTNSWTPEIPAGSEPLYERLLAAMARDVANGVLAPGLRLPPQRELAHAAGLGLGTVTRAYAEAERRGLITARVGRGSFVAERAPQPPEGEINLARNLPPLWPAEGRLAEAVARLQGRPDLLSAAAYAPLAGTDAQRAVTAQWLAFACGLEPPPVERVTLCGGAQQGMALALAASGRPGETVLCEEATFYGLKPLVRAAGYRLAGVALDAEGVVPEALDDAAASTGARIAYLLPTLQNPTARTMSIQRREAIAEVARRRDLTLIEDDVYGLYAGTQRPPPLAAYAPERTFFVASLSKIVAPGLRAGVVVAPDAARQALVLQAAEGLAGTGDPFGRMIASAWIENGTAAAVAGETVAEAKARLDLALRVLAPWAERPAGEASLHLWLPMTELEAERAAGRALRAGVRLTPPDAPLVGGGATQGLRVCLGAVRTRESLEVGLRRLAEALAGREQAETALV